MSAPLGNAAPPIGPRNRPARSVWITPLVLGLVAFVVVLPFDGPLSSFFSGIGQRLGGDVRRELHAWQQFGAVGSIVFTVLAIYLLDRGRLRRVGDLLIAVGISLVICQGMKMLIGRPRPRDHFDDPRTFLGPWGKYPVEVGGEARLVHAWDIPGGAGSDLWAMPSSHTFYAVVLAVFLCSAYPKGKPLWIGLAVLVGFCRLLFDAHWPTDVIVGAAVGAAVSGWVMSVSKSAQAEAAT
ncbi:MAG: phosphatase PAP2 family protein [Phycisphaeraceae bacterium]|nr:phosphatase PAP2 family protein [Phycisphaeraceae bacterium]